MTFKTWTDGSTFRASLKRLPRAHVNFRIAHSNCQTQSLSPNFSSKLGIFRLFFSPSTLRNDRTCDFMNCHGIFRMTKRPIFVLKSYMSGCVKCQTKSVSQGGGREGGRVGELYQQLHDGGASCQLLTAAQQCCFCCWRARTHFGTTDYDVNMNCWSARKVGVSVLLVTESRALVWRIVNGEWLRRRRSMREHFE